MRQAGIRTQNKFHFFAFHFYGVCGKMDSNISTFFPLPFQRKKGVNRSSLPKWFKLLTEVSLQQPLEAPAVSCFVASHLVDGVVDMAKPAFVEKVRNIKENNNIFGTTFQSNRYELTITFNIF